MNNKLKSFVKNHLKKEVPEIKPGDTLKVYQKIPVTGKTTAKTGKQETKKIQVFEGVVIAKRRNKEMGTTITVRKVISGIGVEKIFPIHSPSIEKIEIISRGKTRRAKLYYLRAAKGKKARLKKKEVIKKQ